MGHRRLRWAVLMIVLFSACVARAESSRVFTSSLTDRSPDKSGGSAASPFGPFFEPVEYMKNWEFGVNFDEQQGPLYFADLFFPLYRPDAEDRVLFLEPRVNHVDSETLFNLGLGYRHLVRDRSWMLGANTFFDWETEQSHHRVGFGLEAISSYAELRANSYWGLSLAKTSEPGLASNRIEKPVDGFDVEVGAPVPYYSRLKFFGGYEWYDFKKFKNREGWTARAEYKPIPALVLDVLLADNNKQDLALGMTIAFRPPFWDKAAEKPRSPLQRDPIIFPEADVGDRLYTLVERHHEIVVERYRENQGSVTVEIARGT